MRVLVTGGAGFVGSHLCEALLLRGQEVLCLDNFFTGRRANIDHLRASPAFEIIRHDVIEPILLEVDRVYHLACPASPVHYQHNPVKTVQTSVVGTINILDVCRRTGARFLLASTSEIYGDPQVHPQTEGYWGNVNTLGPRACYDEGKRVAETLASDYARQYGVDARIARIFNTYGPRMALDDGRVVSNFCVQALRGEDITVYGGGQQTRSFCYVNDLVDGLIRLMEAAAVPGPVNLGNPHEITVQALAERIIALVGRGTIVNRPLPADDPTRRCPDITRARTWLDWHPLIPLEEGLARVVPYFRELLERPSLRSG